MCLPHHNLATLDYRFQNKKDILWFILYVPVVGFSVIFAFAILMAYGVFAEEKGGTLRFATAYGSSVSSLDPHRTTRTQDDTITISIHRSLYRWDSSANKPKLELATHVDVSDNGLSYIYHLRKNIFFHHGRQMVAEDIVKSYLRIMDPKIPSPGARYVRIIEGAAEYEKGQADRITGLDVIDDFTLKITFTNRVDPGYSLFWPMTAILPLDEVEKAGNSYATAPVGLGPFKFSKWVKGSMIEVIRNDNFYLDGKPLLDKVEYYIMGEAAARDLSFRAGELDVIKLSAIQFVRYSLDDDLKNSLLVAEEGYTRHVGFHPDVKPLQDVRVRRAFNYAIDSELIVEKLLKGMGTAASGWVPTFSEAYDVHKAGYDYNPDKARELLKEAGYENGFDLEIVTTNSKSYGLGIVEAIMPMLNKVGIRLIPKLVENAVGQELVFVQGKFESYMWSFNSGPDPLAALQRFSVKTPRNAGNYISYNNPEYDDILEQAANAGSPEEKNQLLQAANNLLIDDAPLWFFSYNMAVLAHQPNVHGFQANSVEIMYQYLDDIWIEQTVLLGN